MSRSIDKPSGVTNGRMLAGMNGLSAEMTAGKLAGVEVEGPRRRFDELAFGAQLEGVAEVIVRQQVDGVALRLRRQVADIARHRRARPARRVRPNRSAGIVGQTVTVELRLRQRATVDIDRAVDRFAGIAQVADEDVGRQVRVDPADVGIVLDDVLAERLCQVRPVVVRQRVLGVILVGKRDIAAAAGEIAPDGDRGEALRRVAEVRHAELGRGRALRRGRASG